MSSKKFKFVSPGIFLNEIDNSQLPAAPTADGPIIIGRSRKGPAMRPYKVSSFEEFVRVFGAPVAGGENEDVWREGNLAGPTYAAYAARAWLASETAPVTFFRLLGEENSSATSAGKAGWKNSGTPSTTAADNGGAYGLFIIDRTGSTGRSPEATAANTGSLAAIWYLEAGNSITLSGNLRAQDDSTHTGSAALFNSETAAGSAAKQFTAQIHDSDGNVAYKTAFNFSRNSEYYIRKRFNTNPMMTNSSYVDSSGLSQGENTYWLGETYTTFVNNQVTGGVGEQFGFIAALESGSVSWDERQGSFANSRTPWFFSQDMSTDYASYDAKNMTKLFRFHGLDHGSWIQNNIKVSIANLQASNTSADPYGTFDVLLRSAQDTDKRPQILERYSGVSLNPDATNYIARQIGDVYTAWDNNHKVNRQYGNYGNRSEFVRIEVNPDIDNALTDPELLPFGVFGPPRPLGFSLCSGSVIPGAFGKAEAVTTLGAAGSYQSAFLELMSIRQRIFDADGGDTDGASAALLNVYTRGGEGDGEMEFTGSYRYPAPRTRMSASEGGYDSKTGYEKAYFGLSTDIGFDILDTGTSTNYSNRFDPGYGDYLRGLPLVDGASEDSRFDSISGPPTNTEYSWMFSLDDIKIGPDNGDDTLPFWTSGSRAAGTSVTALSGGYKELIRPTGSAAIPAVNKFTAPFYGGHDGFDIREAEPLNNTDLSGKTVANWYAYHTLDRAIEAVADPEAAPGNILTMPGVTNKGLTQKLIDVAEERADALAIVDIENVYTPRTEATTSFKSRLGSVTSAISSLATRDINSSYACAYYPWVQIQDPINRQRVWVPPSVVALGTFASSDAKSAVWFAPAGFNRGGLSDPMTAGMRVMRVTERVVSKDRDRLYAANINPIAQFPNEGIVVFGQKTLQMTQSALDRINVRRMMIYVKKEISKISTRILFDQNVEVTWDRFKAQTDGFLSSVKSSLGITAYKIVLDETTTTPDLIDRNILYAKIFLKPARSIEFIAIDFIITRTGASFDD